MTKDEFNKIFSVSIIDIVGEMNNGLAILFNILINNKESYELLFWYNEEGSIVIEPENKFLERLGVTDIKDYSNYEPMAFVIYSNIPNPDGLLDKYLNENNGQS